MISINYIENKLSNQIKTPDVAEKAGVLIPIIQNTQGELHLLFQIRSAQLKWQPNDICFPGGRMEEQDKTPIDTALRETQEELGVDAKTIKVCGQLPPFISPLGLKIYPIIGHLTCLEFNLNQDEVSDVFTVPIEWFMANPPTKSTMQTAFKPADDFPFHLVKNRSRNWQKHAQHEVHFYHYQQYTIWGLTAKIVQSFITMIS